VPSFACESQELALLAKLLRGGAQSLEAGAHVVWTINNPDVLTIDVCTGQDRALRLLRAHIAVYRAKVRADAAQRARRQSARAFACTLFTAQRWETGRD